MRRGDDRVNHNRIALPDGQSCGEHGLFGRGEEEEKIEPAIRALQARGLEVEGPLPADTLLSRGMMGDGHIDFPHLTACVAAAGYRGDVEVEIFNADVWAADGDAVLATLARRYVELVEPHL